MAKKVGRNGLVKIGSATVAELNGWTLDESMSPIDSSNLGDQELTYEAGDITRTGTIDCHWDKADATGQGAMDIGATVSMVLQPEGDVSGDETISFSALITNKGKAVAKQSMISQSFAFQVSGSVTVSAVA